MNPAKKNSIAVNIIHLFYSTALSSAINAIALILLAGYLQSHQYGLFSVALAFAMIMGYFTDAGLSDIVLREGAKQEVSLSRLMSSYIKMRTFLLVVTFALGFLVIHLMNGDNTPLLHTAYALVIPMVTGIALQSIGTTFFRLTERMQYFGLIRLASAVTLLTTLGVGMLLGAHPLLMAMIYGCSYMAAGIFGIILVKKHVTLSLRQPFHSGLLRNLGAFTLGGLLFVLLPHLGPIILEKTITLREVGLFAVAYRIPQALQQIPFVVAGAYYPVLFKHFHNQRFSEHFDHHLTQIKVMGLIGMVIAIPLYHLSEFIVSFLFGQEWLDAALPLKILAMMLILQSVNTALADGLTTVEKQNARTIVQVIAVLSGVLFYIFLSKSYGVVGAAVAGVIVEGIALTGFWICTATRWKLLKRAILPYLSFFLISTVGIEWMLGNRAWAGTILHTLLLLSILMMDRQLRDQIVQLVVEKKRAWRMSPVEGAKKERVK
ncbi:oligosaccharide flippase family protein [Salimicrobium halophilum]|uniref:Membrane protein involved in the export of O-antigen and teichoic acid n=1 Tax=Salimicrobium halophilum TaxID=86666 RepID=A0A1G8SBG7_9BACI|nr:oligosaccharide flippase family protein [Salimicrobium halophilum]SDJ26558.1 Membrane protein involved in the export of O-antigen and teichoic acid [Salimicrobium halophilum]